MAASLDPTPLSRLSQFLRPDWSRTVRARRVVAAGLVVLAAVAALRSGPTGDRVDVVVSAHDLKPGTALTAADIHIEKRVAATVPDGARADPDTVIGSTLAGPARRGEILTDVRLVGTRLADAAAGPHARMVAVHPADPAVVDLVRSGDIVDILTASDAEPRPHLVAGDAVVVLVSATDQARGPDIDRVVLVALPAGAAIAVAAAALVQPVTLTLH